MTARQFALPDGRAMGMTGFGDAMADRMVVMCHPAPGAGDFDPDPGVTVPWGVHMVGLDRPGYGGSDVLPAGEGTSFTDRADEIATYLSRVERNAQRIESLEFGPVGAIGWGAGGLVALALAARHADLIDRVAVVDTPSPRSFPTHLPPGPPYPLGSLGIAQDDAMLTIPSLERRLDRMLESAGTHGDAGLSADMAAYGDSEWLKELGTIRAEVLLVYGEGQPQTSADMDGRWFQHRITGARLARVQNGRSLSIVTQWQKILEHVAPQHGHVSAEVEYHIDPSELPTL